MDISIDKVVGNGNTVSFWTDRCCSHTTLVIVYPSLFSIASHPNITVFSVFSSGSLNLHFVFIFDGVYLDE
jgi:hypothetical protein